MGQQPTAMRGPRGIYPGNPDPSVLNRYDPYKTRHAVINEAIQPSPKVLNKYEQMFIPKETTEQYFQRVYEYLCKTAQEIDPELLRVEELLLKLEEQPLVLYARYPTLAKRRAIEVDFYYFAERNYGVSWRNLPRKKILVRYICQLLQDEFIKNDQTEMAIESMFALLPHDVLVKIMEYSRPTQISVGGQLLRIYSPPQLNKRLAVIYKQLVLKPAMKNNVMNVALSASLMVTDISGYYTSLYNRNTGTKDFNPYGSRFVGKFTDQDEDLNLKPLDSKEFSLFYRSDAQDTSNTNYSYGIKIVPEAPYHIEGEFMIPHKIPLGFKIQQIKILNITKTDQNGNIVPEIERYPSFFIDNRDPINVRTELDNDTSEDISGVDLGFFLGYLTCVMSVIDSDSKIQFRTFLDQDPRSNDKSNLIHKQRFPNKHFIRTNIEMNRILTRDDPSNMLKTLSAPYLTGPFKTVASSLIDSMLYMGLPLAGRVRRDFSMIWDVNTVVKNHALIPKNAIDYWTVINRIERNRSYAEIQGYNVEPAFLWTFKAFVENSSNTDLVKRILEEYFYVGIGSNIVEESIIEFKRVLSLKFK